MIQEKRNEKNKREYDIKPVNAFVNVAWLVMGDTNEEMLNSSIQVLQFMTTATELILVLF